MSCAAATSRVVIDLASKNSRDGTSMDFSNSIENATGGAGSDIIYGDGVNNVLNDGAGIDYMYGGAGSYTASYAGCVQSCDRRVDRFGDMTAGVNKIRLDASGLGGLSSTAGVLDASSFTVGASASAALAQFICDSATGSLSYDADGTGRVCPCSWRL